MEKEEDNSLYTLAQQEYQERRAKEAAESDEDTPPEPDEELPEFDFDEED